mmetsp:Transcript_19112/g.26115  ORF Transcript_19112/g.26115 Transcript_19112/m.26115 type:complete len:115 (+) Transcript_19112:332-676(+)
MNDPSGVLVVKYETMIKTLEVVHKKKIGTSTSLQRMADGLKERFPFEISLINFISWCRTTPAILSPAIILQLKLRRCILGERFWVHHTCLRSQLVKDDNKVKYIIQLREKLKAI